MQTFRRITLIAFGIIALLCLYAATKPDTFRVERSIDINASAEALFPMINDLQNFTRWSPYAERDPAMKQTFSPVTSGKGAFYAWEGNKQVGSGRMEITQSLPLQQVTLQIDFFVPFEAHNTVFFTLAPVNNGTRASWAMEGPMPFISKLMSIFFDFDGMVGNDFAAGLEKLKALVEKPV
ncbi:MAG: SRPBCC family protein [Rhodocyclaceae bacterium]|nr:SRPBCC family protein [Rhodocyclaceae bacterium]